MFPAGCVFFVVVTVAAAAYGFEKFAVSMTSDPLYFASGK